MRSILRSSNAAEIHRKTYCITPREVRGIVAGIFPSDAFARTVSGAGGVKKAAISQLMRLSCGLCWSGRRVSNPQHPAWKASALPIELLPPAPLSMYVAGMQPTCCTIFVDQSHTLSRVSVATAVCHIPAPRMRTKDACPFPDISPSANAVPSIAAPCAPPKRKSAQYARMPPP
jgi:hypothetical protein